MGRTLFDNVSVIEAKPIIEKTGYYIAAFATSQKNLNLNLREKQKLYLVYVSAKF